jgi:hypothetical protein
MNYVFFINFVLTVCVEFIVLYFFVKNMSYYNLFFYSLLINLFTWPLANLYYGFGLNFFAVELGVVLAESLLFRYFFEMKYKRALLVSFLVNGVTALMGFFSSFLF